jgi:hypothetical protein
VLERAGLAEAGLERAKTDAARWGMATGATAKLHISMANFRNVTMFIVQVLKHVIAMLCEAKPALTYLAAREEQGVVGDCSQGCVVRYCTVLNCVVLYYTAVYCIMQCAAAEGIVLRPRLLLPLPWPLRSNGYCQQLKLSANSYS